MNRELIIDALESACENKSFNFQVTLRDSQLHIYVHYQPQHQIDRLLLKDNVTSAIANLSLDFLEAIWLYGCLSGETKPIWQTLVRRSLCTDPREDSILGSSRKIDNYSNLALPVALEVVEDDSTNDTRLLHDTGMVHSRALEQEFDLSKPTLEPLTVLQVVDPNLEDCTLARYCFVSDRQLLASDTFCPKREVKRLIIFFHHFSLDERHRLLPIVDSYFRGERYDGELPVALQLWFKHLKKLDRRDRQVLAVWLSRYCSAPNATLKELETARDVVFVNSDRHIDNSLTSVQGESHQPTVKQLRKTSKRPIFFSKPILPSIWILATVVLIILRISSNNLAPATPEDISFCRDTTNTDYCRLAVNLVGEKSLTKLSGSLFPLTEVTEAVATYNCEKYANLKAGASDILPEQTPVISSYGEKILPHIYVVEARQNNYRQSGDVRVGCVYTAGRGQRSPKLLAADIIPDNWRTEQYLKESRFDSHLAFKTYDNLIKFGLYTLFASLGIAIAIKLNLGIKFTS